MFIALLYTFYENQSNAFISFSRFRKLCKTLKRGWDKSPSLSIVFGLSSKTQWLSRLYYADSISFYSPTQLCRGGTTKSNSNELPISVPLSQYLDYVICLAILICRLKRSPGLDEDCLRNPYPLTKIIHWIG